MPVSDLIPTDTSGVPYDEWAQNGGSSKANAVSSNDGGASSIVDGVGNRRQCFNVGWPGFVGAVNSLATHAWVAEATGQWWFTLGCRNANGETAEWYEATSSYALYTRANNRPGGGSWGPADCASGVTWVQIMNDASPGSGACYCTYIYFQLDYNVAGNCVIVQILSALLPLIGPGLVLSHMEGINRLLYRLTRTRLRPDEYAAALESLRAYRRPAFAFLDQPAML